MNSTEERSGGGVGAMQNSRCFYETFQHDRIYYLGPPSAFWESRAHHYCAIERKRRDDVVARALFRANFVCLHIDAFLREVDVQFEYAMLSNSRLGYVAKRIRPRTRALLTYYANIEVDYIKNKYHSRVLTAVDGAIFKLREAQCSRLTDFSLFITQRDRNRYGDLYGTTRHAMLPVATDRRIVEKQPATHARMAFLGSLGYKPNIEATEYIVREILPRTSYRLLLAGSDPSREVCELVAAHRDRIDFHPNFASLDGLLTDRDVLVSPLAHGAGMKVKVADWIAMAMPVLGSAETFVGYDALPHVDYLTCRSADDYILKLQHLAEPQRYSDVSRDLHAAWQRHYSMDASVASFKETCANLHLSE